MMAENATMIRAREHEDMLPWRATGQLARSEARQIDRAMARDTLLARTFAGIRRERADIVAINEALGLPSPRAMIALFAAIDLDARLAKKNQ